MRRRRRCCRPAHLRCAGVPLREHPRSPAFRAMAGGTHGSGRRGTHAPAAAAGRRLCAVFSSGTRPEQRRRRTQGEECFFSSLACCSRAFLLFCAGRALALVGRWDSGGIQQRLPCLLCVPAPRRPARIIARTWELGVRWWEVSACGGTATTAAPAAKQRNKEEVTKKEAAA